MFVAPPNNAKQTVSTIQNVSETSDSIIILVANSNRIDTVFHEKNHCIENTKFRDI